MSSRCSRLFCPRLVLPVSNIASWLVSDTLPPDISIGSLGDICVDGVLLHASHSVGVRVFGSTRGDSEEAVFWIDSSELSIFVEFHPGDIITNALDFPSGNSRCHHSKVCLSAGTGEGGGNILLLALRIGDSEDEHVLGEPSLIA